MTGQQRLPAWMVVTPFSWRCTRCCMHPRRVCCLSHARELAAQHIRARHHLDVAKETTR